MDREILFRGKRVDNGEWEYGSLVLMDNGEAKIVIHGGWIHVQVDPSTVGEYTGLTDKNGKRIFEGDILRLQKETRPGLDGQLETRYENRYVHFDEGGFCAGNNFLQSYLLWAEFQGEVIGNIHDNPELLEVTP